MALDPTPRSTYRYRAHPVRDNTRIKLRFWYKIAAGTEGEYEVLVGGKRTHILASRKLDAACFKKRLSTIGRWTKYEQRVQAEPQATRLTPRLIFDDSRRVQQPVLGLSVFGRFFPRLAIPVMPLR